MNQNEPMEFSTSLDFIAVTLKDGDKGDIAYELRELTGTQRDEYMSFLQKRTRISPTTGKPMGLTDVKGLQSRLLSMSLYDVGEQRYVTEAEANKLPNRIIDQLVDKVSEMSRLGMSPSEKKAAEEGEQGNDA